MLEAHHHTILLVEDDPDDVLMITEVLSDNNNPPIIIHKKNGLEAWHYLKRLQEEKQPLPCLIIMDVNMPVFDGKKLLTVLKNDLVFLSIPIVVFTTSSSPIDREFFKHYDVPMITKPRNMEGFTLTVKSFLDHCCQHT